MGVETRWKIGSCGSGVGLVGLVSGSVPSWSGLQLAIPHLSLPFTSHLLCVCHLKLKHCPDTASRDIFVHVNANGHVAEVKRTVILLEKLTLHLSARQSSAAGPKRRAKRHTTTQNKMCILQQISHTRFLNLIQYIKILFRYLTVYFLSNKDFYFM